MLLRQYSKNCQSDINLTFRKTSKFDIIKLINSFTSTIRSNATLSPRLYEIVDIRLLAKLL